MTGTLPGRELRTDAAPTVDLRTCAEEVLHLLAVHGVEILFLNPGTDSAPLQEAAMALAERGVELPRIVGSTFESVALAAAHGYWQATRRPQAVFVHVDVGTQNLGAVVHDVLRDRAGVVVMAGKTPYAEDAGSPGARSHVIHWQQDVPDQAGILRSYAKWTAELTRAHDTARVVGRAVQVAAGGIPGLAYLTLSRDVLMEPAGPMELRRVTGFARPLPAAVEEGALEEVADRLAGAERPVIVATRVGRYPGGAEALGAVADAAAIPVVGRPEAVNVCAGHPMYVRSQAQAASLLASADLVLIVECDVPWLPRETTLRSGSYVVQIDSDPVKADMPLWSFPIDLALCADPVVGLRQLAGALERRRDRAAGRWEARRRELQLEIASSNHALRAAAADAGPTDVRGAMAALNGALEPDDLVVEETVSNLVSFAELLDRPHPETLYSAGGPGLGWSPGAAVGIKLARPDRRVVAVLGDGSFLFGSPAAALSLAAEAGAPVVMVVINNRGYRASRLPVLELFPDGVSARRGEVIGASFSNPVDFVGLAEACGAYGTRTDAAGLPDALARAFAATEQGSAAVIDLRVEQ